MSDMEHTKFCFVSLVAFFIYKEWFTNKGNEQWSNKSILQYVKWQTNRKSITHKQLGPKWQTVPMILKNSEYYLSVNEVWFTSLNNSIDIGIVRQKCAHFCPTHIILINYTVLCFILYWYINIKMKRNNGHTLFHEMLRGHGGRVVTLSPPTSEAGVQSPSWP